MPPSRPLFPLVVCLATALAFARPAIAAQIQTVVLEDDAAPDTGAGVRFSAFPNLPVINADGELAFIAGLIGTGIVGDNSSGLWSGAPGNLQLVIRRGDATPGISGGTFDFFPLDAPLIADDGQAVVKTPVEGTTFFDESVWIGTPGNIRLVARERTQPPGEAAGVEFRNADVNFDTFQNLRVDSTAHVAFEGFVSGTGIVTSSTRTRTPRRTTSRTCSSRKARRSSR